MSENKYTSTNRLTIKILEIKKIRKDSREKQTTKNKTKQKRWILRNMRMYSLSSFSLFLLLLHPPLLSYAPLYFCLQQEPQLCPKYSFIREIACALWLSGPLGGGSLVQLFQKSSVIFCFPSHFSFLSSLIPATLDF